MREGAFVRLMNWVFGRAGGQASEAFETFQAEFFDDPDGFDLDHLRALRGRERRSAERMLLAILPDPRALLGLSALATRRARRRLTRIFAREARNGGPLLIATASALWAISPQPRYALAVAQRLRHAPAASERRDAAAALAGMASVDVEDALDDALDDFDPLVRHHAARALLALYGAPADAAGLRILAQRIVGRERRGPTRAPLSVVYRESSRAAV